MIIFNGLPHNLQIFEVLIFSVSQLGRYNDFDILLFISQSGLIDFLMGLPHNPQNFTFLRFSVPQLGQIDLSPKSISLQILTPLCLFKYLKFPPQEHPSKSSIASPFFSS